MLKEYGLYNTVITTDDLQLLTGYYECGDNYKHLSYTIECQSFLINENPQPYYLTRMRERVKQQDIYGMRK